MRRLNQSIPTTLTGWLTNAGRILFIAMFLLAAFVSPVRADPANPTADPAAPAVDPSAPAEANAVLPASLFGFQMWPMSAAGGGNYMQGTYTRWVRGPEIIWKDVEKTKGVYDWTAIDKAVQDIQYAANIYQGSISVIVVVRGTPSWAQANPPFSCGPIKPSEYQTFGYFMFNLITELANRGITYVKYWEIWNEPDIQPIDGVADPDQNWGGCWGDTADPYFGGRAYGDMLKQIYPIIKTKDPNAQVMVGGLNLDCDPRFPPPAGKSDCNSSKFFEGVLVSGAGNYFDGVAYHAYDYAIKDQGGAFLLGQYNNPNWPGSAWNQMGPSLIQKSRYLKSLMTQYNVSGKFLMNTENSLLDAPFSTNTNPYPPILETTKAYYLAQAYAAAAAEGLKANIWYDVTGSWLRNNGLIKKDASDVLDAYWAYVWAANNSSNSCIAATFKYLNPLNFPGVAGYEFGVIPPATQVGTCPAPAPNPYHVWLMWSKDGAIHTITLPSAAYIVYDVKGTPIFQDIQKIDITRQPFYIIMGPVQNRSLLPVVNRDLYNGNFELQWTNWTGVNANLPYSLQTTNPVDPRDPTKNTKDYSVPSLSTSVLLGDSNLGLGQSKGNCTYTNVPVGFAAANRYVFVPAAPPGQNIKLQFNYIIYSQDTYGNSSDQFELWISIYDPNTGTFGPAVRMWADGNKAFVSADVCRWYRVPSTENARDGVTSGWATQAFDITPYAGNLLQVSFRNYNRIDGWYNTYTYVDNVQVKFVKP